MAHARYGRGDARRPVTEAHAQLEEFYARYRGSVFGLCYRLMGRHVQDSEDLLHQTYLAAYQELLDGATIARPLPWLLAIAHNRARDVWRRRYRYTVVPYAPDLDDRRGTDPPADAALWAALHRSEVGADVAARLAACTAEQRTALLLLAAGWGYPAIARRLGKSHQAVKSLIHRARRTAQQGRGVFGPK